MDSINGVSEKNQKMDKNLEGKEYGLTEIFVDENCKPLGLLEQIRLKESKSEIIHLFTLLSKPWPKPRTNIIIMGARNAELFLEAIKNYGRKN